MAKKTEPAINKNYIIAEVNRFQILLCQTDSPKPAVFKFPPTAIADLEVVNPVELETQVKSFVAQQKIAPSGLIIIVSADLCFEKDLTSVAEADRPEAISQFLDAVPLSSVSSKVFKIQNTYRLIAINRNFYESIKQAFENQGFEVIAVTPAAALGLDKSPSPLSAASCRIILKKITEIKDNSFLREPGITDFSQKRQRFVQSHQLQLGIMSVIFMMFGIGVGMVTLRRPTNTPASAHQPVHPPASSPSPANLQVVDFSQVKLQVLGSAENGEDVIQVQQQLAGLGFVSIEVGSTASLSRTRVIFSPTLSASVRQIILDAVKKSHPNLTSQENILSNYDAQIVLGQTTP